MNCKWHLCENELSGRQTAYCSVKCKNKYLVTLKRRGLKLQLVTEAGGKCLDCGYTGPPFMFDFDHREPSLKEFSISKLGNTIGIEKLRAEIAKCDLVCSNCHRYRTHLQRCNGCIYCT